MSTLARFPVPAICITLLFAGAAFAAAVQAAPDGRMKAIVYHEYGPPEVLRLEELEKPAPGEGEVLIKVRAASVNPLDWHYLRGTPYFLRLVEGAPFRPAVTRLGIDMAGVVEAVGAGASRFKPGDEVFGFRYGAFAEYVRVSETGLALKPANISFEEAAAVPIAGVSALQGLRDSGRIKAGQQVLINGASGGVGTFAVQIAKSLGAVVTGVCSTRNAKMVRELGADRVIDYTREDFTKGSQRYDLILDMVGNHPLSALRGAMTPNGVLVMVGSKDTALWLGPLVGMLESFVYSAFISQDLVGFLATQKQQDLEVLAGMMRAGTLKPVIDRSYTLAQVSEAIGYVEKGHSRGKVVISIADSVAADVAPAEAPPGGNGAKLRFFGILCLLVGVPVMLALLLNQRFQRANPARRPFRWGFYFALQSLVCGVGLGYLLESGLLVGLGCALVYTSLAWFFVQRHHWAWIALTLLSFNPIAWIVNFVYLRRRWSEQIVAPG